LKVCVRLKVFVSVVYFSKPATPDLREFLMKARRGAVRVVKIVIMSGE